MPEAPVYSAADFQAAGLAALPSGPIWAKDQDSVLAKVALGLAQAYATLSARAVYLLQDSPTGELVERLPEWEATLGLPDPCAGENPTLQQRRMQVQAKIAARGGQSIAYLTAFAASLGMAITITEFRPSISGRMRSGDPVASADWAHAWRVTAPATVVISFRSGASVSGERLRAWGSSVLECEFARIKPAHTEMQLAYVGDASGNNLGFFMLGRDNLTTSS